MHLTELVYWFVSGWLQQLLLLKRTNKSKEPAPIYSAT